jgi:type I restriction enzyme, R subunit
MTPAPYTEDTLVQQTTAEYLQQELGWESVYAYNNEVFLSNPHSGPLPGGEGEYLPEGKVCLGRESDREVVLTPHPAGQNRRIESRAACHGL